MNRWAYPSLTRRRRRPPHRHSKVTVLNLRVRSVLVSSCFRTITISRTTSQLELVISYNAYNCKLGKDEGNVRVF